MGADPVDALIAECVLAQGARSRRPETATVAACGFGGILATLLKSDAVMNLLTDLLKSALNFIL
jgi:Protein of unknown function (DUF4244)